LHALVGQELVGKLLDRLEEDLDVARPLAEAYVEYLAIGEELPEMPLFLQVDTYVNVPLEPTYATAHRGLPLYLREVLDGRRGREPR
jgi:hypothetical protein